MALNSGLAPNAVQTALDLVFNAAFDYEEVPGIATAMDSSVFRQDSTDRAAVITEQFQGGGYFSQRTENADAAEATMRVGNQKTFSILAWSQNLPLSKHYFDDDLWSTVEMGIQNMARNARMTRDRHAFERYNLGFTTETTNDGVAIFSNSHTTLDNTTVDNLETGVLSPDNLETLVVSLVEQQTQDGVLGAHNPACLLVPPALFKDAQEITKSELAALTADNELNYYSQTFPGLMIKQSPFLGANRGPNGSDTAYFLLSANHSMTRWVRKGMETHLNEWWLRSDNAYEYKAEYREQVGAITYEGLVASNGTV